MKKKIFFFQADCPDGNLGKEKILDMYSMILPVKNATVFVDQIFRIFDKDGNGSIDFKVNKTTFMSHLKCPKIVLETLF